MSRKRRTDKPPRSAPAEPPPPTGMPGPARPAPARRLVGWRRWALRLALAVVAPVIALAALEGVLRLAGYGRPTALFLRSPAGDLYVADPRFSERFFPPGLARCPDFAWFAADKPAGTYRIFVLGASAAMGVPDPSYSLARVLEVMLRERYPGVRFEVVSAAMTAINSHVVRLIARDCARHRPDLFVVYLGNNEVIGPFGPGTVFQRHTPSLALVRASLAAKETRLGQLLGAAARALAPGEDRPARWGGMEMFMDRLVPADDPRLADTRAHFRANLADICLAARRAGARTILCTVVTNLKDCPPLASAHRAGLGDGDRARWQAAHEAGVALEAQGDRPAAADRYRAALAADGAFAETHYRLARAALALGRTPEAREHFRLARDLDALRFRADTQTNEILRQAAADFAADGVRLVDAERAFEADPATPHGLVGNEWLYEHVHLRFAGTCLLARRVAEAVEAVLPEPVRAAGPAADWPGEARCADLLVLTGWNRHRMAKSMGQLASRPPFTGQVDAADRQAAARREADALRHFRAPDALRAAAQAYRAALDRRPDDYVLQANLAILLDEADDFEAALALWRSLLVRFPGHRLIRTALGTALVHAGRTDEAVTLYEDLLRDDPTSAAVWKNYGDALVLRKQVEQGVARYREAVRLNPDYADAHHNLGGALKMLGRDDEAAPHLAEAVRLQPSPTGHFNLANLLVKQGRLREALDHYGRALALDPDADLAAAIRRNLAIVERRLQPAAEPGPQAPPPP